MSGNPTGWPFPPPPPKVPCADVDETETAPVPETPTDVPDDPNSVDEPDESA